MEKGKWRELQSEIIIVWQFLSLAYPVLSPGQELIQKHGIHDLIGLSFLSPIPTYGPTEQLCGHWTGFFMLLRLCL